MRRGVRTFGQILEMERLARGGEERQEIAEGKVEGEHAYALTLTETQASILSSALDLFVRIGLGQFDQVLDAFDREYHLSFETRERMVALLGALRSEAGFVGGAYYGILNPKVDDRFRIAYDVHQVLRHCLAWDKDAASDRVMRGVDFDDPHQTSAHALPDMKRVR